MDITKSIEICAATIEEMQKAYKHNKNNVLYLFSNNYH